MLLIISIVVFLSCNQLIQVASLLELVPDYCFNRGNCSFDFIITHPAHDHLFNNSYCLPKCGPSEGAPRLIGSCNINSTHRFQCPLGDYSSHYIEINQTNQVDISVDYCLIPGSACWLQYDSRFAPLNKLINWYDTPTISGSYPPFKAYDSIEHEITFSGNNFNAFYQPYIILSFDSSKLSSQQSKANCSLRIDCNSTADGQTLTCLKPAFPDECLPKEPNEMGHWDAKYNFYSHNNTQTLYLNPTIKIAQFPKRPFTAIDISRSLLEKRFVLNPSSNGEDLIFSSDVNCVVNKTGESLTNITLDHSMNLTFQFDASNVVGETLVCSILMDGRYHFQIEPILISNRSSVFYPSFIVITFLFLGLSITVGYGIYRLVLRSYKQNKRNGKS